VSRVCCPNLKEYYLERVIVRLVRASSKAEDALSILKHNRRGEARKMVKTQSVNTCLYTRDIEDYLTWPGDPLEEDVVEAIKWEATEKTKREYLYGLPDSVCMKGGYF